MSEHEAEVDVDKEIIHEETRSGKRVKLTKIETMSQLLTFLVAGYETTATTIHFVLYLLAVHPEVQDKVADEISKVIGETVRGIFILYIINIFSSLFFFASENVIKHQYYELSSFVFKTTYVNLSPFHIHIYGVVE